MPAPLLKRITQRRVVLLVTVAIVGSIGTGLVFGSDEPTTRRARLSAVTVEPGSTEKKAVPPARSTRARSKPRHVTTRPPARRAARQEAAPEPPIQAAAPSPYDLPVNPYSPSPYDLPPAKKGTTPTQTTQPDRTKPIIVIPAGLNRVIVVRSDGTFFFVLGPFSEDVAGTVVFSTDKPVSVARKKRLVLARERLSIRAGKRVKLKVKLNKRGRRAIRRLRRIKARAQFAVIDAAGNRSDRRFKFTLKAAKVKKHKRR